MLGLFFVVICLPFLAYDVTLKKRAEALAAEERRGLVNKIFRT
jgi:hypothetical protein